MSDSTPTAMPLITWSDFEKIELRVGRITGAAPYPEARKPAYKLVIDFGPELGTRRSSSQLTGLYTPETLIGRLVLAVINFPPRQVGKFISECLITGFATENGAIALCVPDGEVPLGSRLF